MDVKGWTTFDEMDKNDMVEWRPIIAAIPSKVMMKVQYTMFPAASEAVYRTVSDV